MFALFQRVHIKGKNIPDRIPGKKAILTDLIKRETGIISWSDQGYQRRKPVKVTVKKSRKVKQ